MAGCSLTSSGLASTAATSGLSAGSDANTELASAETVPGVAGDTGAEADRCIFALAVLASVGEALGEVGREMERTGRSAALEAGTGTIAGDTAGEFRMREGGPSAEVATAAEGDGSALLGALLAGETLMESEAAASSSDSGGGASIP